MLGFFSYSLTMAITPGPNNIMAMQESRQRGFRGALPFLGGLLVSFLILDSFCFAFTHVLSTISPKVLIGLRVIGSLYLVYLVVGLFRSAKMTSKNQLGQRRFWAAMLLNFLNVKVMLYFLIGYITFLIPIFGAQMGVIFGFGILMSVMTFAANLVWAAAGSVFQEIFNRYAIAVNVVLAGLHD